MTSQSEVESAMAEARQAWERHRETILLLMDVFKITVTELASRMGRPRSTVDGRLKGKKAIMPWELTGFALALEVPEQVLFMTQEEVFRWLADHPRTVRNRCYAVKPLVAA